jgi:hypothetical protein
MLVVLEQFFCQAHGPASVVSDRAINNFDLQHGSLRGYFDTPYTCTPWHRPFGARTGVRQVHTCHGRKCRGVSGSQYKF